MGQQVKFLRLTLDQAHSTCSSWSTFCPWQCYLAHPEICNK